ANTLQDVFTYTMQDAGGLGSTTQITVTIQGANDNPVGVVDTGTATEASGYANATAGSNATGNVLTNDTDVDSVANGETKTVTGVAAGTVSSSVGSVSSVVNGSYGSITINSDGTYNYVVNESNATVQALRLSSQAITDVFSYTVTDVGGLTSTTQVTIAIQGGNDAPIGVDDTATAVEAGGLANGTSGTNPTGNVLTNDTDVDAVANGETKTVTAIAAGSVANPLDAVGSVTGIYGSINIAANGLYAYSLDNTNAAVQALRFSGQTLTDTFTYQMTDAGGLNSLGTVTINIQGSNDNPVAVVDTGTATEAGGYANATVGSNATGNVLTNDTDVDSVANGETKTVTGVAAGTVSSSVGSVSSVVNGSYGSITINGDGTYNYVVNESDATVQALRLTSQTITDVFTYTVTDAGGLTVTTQISITIQGANDGPVSVDDTATAVEAGGLSNGTAGANPTGNLLANDTDVDSSANGETKTVTAIAVGAVANPTGILGTITGTYGSINISSGGAYTYTVDNANANVQAMRLASQTLSETFTYRMSDADGLTSVATLAVTIQGANDTPTAVADTATAVEAGGFSNGTGGTNPSGNVLTNDTDVDSGDTKTVTGVAVGTVASASSNVGASVVGSYGTITISSTGAYSYTLDNTNANVQALRTASNTLSDVFTYTMNDASGVASTTQITVTIQSANDAPVAVADTATAVEAGGVANGTVGANPTGNVLTNDTDVDSGDTKTVSGVASGAVGSASSNVGTVVVGSYGSITITSAGAYTYTVDNSNATVQALRSTGNTLTDVFTYTMQDTVGLASTSQITVTVQGANDAPVAFADTATAVESGGVANGSAGTNPTGNVLTNDTDVDSGDTK
ncbi:MAG: beta strand repeat-containing protein, partial [Pirellula sp.]